MASAAVTRGLDSDHGQESFAQGQSRSVALNEEERGYETRPQGNLSSSKWDPRHFEAITTLGKGSYASVYLVEALHTKQLFAMKVRSKKIVQANSELESISTEKDVLLLVQKEKHPFVVEVFGGFHTQSHFMLYLEFCQGGDLMHHLITGGRFEVERARFYAAEVALALIWFRDMNILYRGLNLHDVLLGVDGHIKLVDFVVSKLGMHPGSRTKTFCGTAEFMPPEMLLDRPYNSSIDWWQLGVITYQMLTQQSPFKGEDEDEIYDAILEDQPLYPSYLTRDAIDFIQKLLEKVPEKRLGSGTSGSDEVMAHAFFRGLNWDDLRHKRIPAPFIPTVSNRTDVSNFDSEYTSLDMPAVIDTSGVLDPEVQERFRGFEFSAE